MINQEIYRDRLFQVFNGSDCDVESGVRSVVRDILVGSSKEAVDSSQQTGEVAVEAVTKIMGSFIADLTGSTTTYISFVSKFRSICELVCFSDCR